jgi:hypothetical protein
MYWNWNGLSSFADLTVLICRDCHEFGFRELDGRPIFNLKGINVIGANNMDSRLVFVHRIEKYLLNEKI